MSSETFIACDAEGCGRATREESDEAGVWYSGLVSMQRLDHLEHGGSCGYYRESEWHACAPEHIGAALLAVGVRIGGYLAAYPGEPS